MQTPCSQRSKLYLDPLYSIVGLGLLRLLIEEEIRGVYAFGQQFSVETESPVLGLNSARDS